MQKLGSFSIRHKLESLSKLTRLGGVELWAGGTAGKTLGTGVDSLVTELLPETLALQFKCVLSSLLDTEKLVVL